MSSSDEQARRSFPAVLDALIAGISGDEDVLRQKLSGLSDRDFARLGNTLERVEGLASVERSARRRSRV